MYSWDPHQRTFIGYSLLRCKFSWQCKDFFSLHMEFNPFSTRPHQNVVWCNNSWLGFYKKIELCTKRKRKKISRKMSPRFSQLNVVIAHMFYFRQNNLWILKLVTYTKIEYHYSTLGANWQLFRWEWIAKCSYSFLLPIWWYNRGLFPLGNKYFGVFVLNGLKPCHKSHVRNFLQNGVGSGYLVWQ